MTRLVNWEARLFDAIKRHADRPFCWGTSDCVSLAADAVEAQSGVDPMAGFRGRYTTEIGAKRILAKESLKGLSGVLDGLFPSVDVNHAQRGDLGLVEYDGANCCVVVMGAHAVGKSISGRLLLPVQLIKQAYKVQ